MNAFIIHTHKHTYTHQGPNQAYTPYIKCRGPGGPGGPQKGLGSSQGGPGSLQGAQKKEEEEAMSCPHPSIAEFIKVEIGEANFPV